jgi:NADPH:quinone reductase-like Zn-dependent oxidoreductase
MTKYGPPEVLQLKELEKPVPKENEVLIKIVAATVTMGDCELRSLKLPPLIRLPMQIYIGIAKPQRITILGQELAGEIEAVGRQVSRAPKWVIRYLHRPCFIWAHTPSMSVCQNPIWY